MTHHKHCHYHRARDKSRTGFLYFVLILLILTPPPSALASSLSSSATHDDDPFNFSSSSLVDPQRANSSASSSINFCAIGDWGGQEWFPYFTYAQQQTAIGLGKVADTIHAQFVVALGDNFYHSGVKTETSHRFQRTFQAVYRAESLTKIPWYVIGGNHDHYGNISAQVAYSNDHPDGRWVFPSLYHSHSFTAADKSFSIDLILIDTVDLCGNNLVQQEHEDGYFDPLPFEEKSHAPEQWKWLEAQLKASTADYLLVGGHFPVYSACSHGPTETLIRHLKPWLQQYQAHYLSGHDHCMMHYQEQDVHFVVSGMGDECCYAATHHHGKNPAAPKWLLSQENQHLYQAMGGFTSFQATEHELKIQYHDHKGHVLFKADPVSPRRVKHGDQRKKSDGQDQRPTT